MKVFITIVIGSHPGPDFKLPDNHTDIIPVGMAVANKPYILSRQSGTSPACATTKRLPLAKHNAKEDSKDQI
jgi:hypothetical protein